MFRPFRGLTVRQALDPLCYALPYEEDARIPAATDASRCSDSRVVFLCVPGTWSLTAVLGVAGQYFRLLDGDRVRLGDKR